MPDPDSSKASKVIERAERATKDRNSAKESLMPEGGPILVNPPAALRARARASFYPLERGPDWAVAVAADTYLTGGMPRTDVSALPPGPSVLLDRFVEKYCLPKHGAAKHDELQCAMAAYYARLARDEAALARLAAERGEYGTRTQLIAQNPSTKRRELQIPLARDTVPGGLPGAPPVSGPGATNGENQSCPPTSPTKQDAEGSA